MTYENWSRKWTQAAYELEQILTQAVSPSNGVPVGSSEARTQQNIRLAVAKQGGMTWRNNVGATPAAVQYSCAKCGFKGEIKQQPVRYGLANDSHQMNKYIKSSDLIGIRPVLITSEMVGTVIGQFLAIECKHEGWSYKGNEHEEAQANWLALITGKGGLAVFSNGSIKL